ncbi:MAG: hypothetical protein ACU826_08680 [Gammaproteobacteria bacterium]
MVTVDFNVISFVLAVVSIFLGLFAIWQAREYRNESKQINETTRELLEEVKIHSTIISQYAIPELKAYGESMRRLIYEEKASKMIEQASSEQKGAAVEGHKNITEELLEEIKFLTKHTGKAVSLELFERLKHKYDFGTILHELLILQKKGDIIWPEAPNPPDALSEIKVIQEQ